VQGNTFRDVKKMITVETVLGMVGREIKENDGGSEFKHSKFDILSKICRCHKCTPSHHNNFFKKKIF
jgi:hypothetical protein